MFAWAEQEMEANGNPAGLDVGSFAYPSGAVGGYLSIKLDSPKLPQQVLLPQVWDYNSEERKHSNWRRRDRANTKNWSKYLTLNAQSFAIYI